MKEKRQTIKIYNIHLAAYLLLHQKEPILELRDGQVRFVYPSTTEVNALRKDYYSGASVPADKFADAIRYIHSRMMTAKAKGRNA